jgi:hypothetical protein
MKLELKHITPYLPYGLKFVFTKEYYYPYPAMQKEGFTFTFDLIESPKVIYVNNIYKKWIDMILEQDYFKPILKPLSDLRDNKDFIRKFGGDNPNNLRMCNLDIDDLINNGLEFETYYGYYEWLIENHFDVFGLIEKNLAIDVNTLSK